MFASNSSTALLATFNDNYCSLAILLAISSKFHMVLSKIAAALVISKSGLKHKLISGDMRGSTTTIKMYVKDS